MNTKSGLPYKSHGKPWHNPKQPGERDNPGSTIQPIRKEPRRPYAFVEVQNLGALAFAADARFLIPYRLVLHALTLTPETPMGSVDVLAGYVDVLAR